MWASGGGGEELQLIVNLVLTSRLPQGAGAGFIHIYSTKWYDQNGVVFDEI